MLGSDRASHAPRSTGVSKATAYRPAVVCALIGAWLTTATADAMSLMRHGMDGCDVLSLEGGDGCGLVLALALATANLAALDIIRTELTSHHLP